MVNMESYLQNKTIGVIGFGNFGKVICKYLFPKNKILVFSNHIESSEFTTNSKKADSLDGLVDESDIIIPAIPIKKFEIVIQNVAKKISREKIIIDICSVMEYPVEVMKKYFPAETPLLATHPMFGPNSIKKNNDSLRNLKIVLSNITLQQNEYELFKDYFKSLNLQLIELTPKLHDEYSARSQFFSLLVGELALNLKLKKTPIDTLGASAIFDAISYMGQDREIIEDMITFNSFSKKIYSEIIKDLKKLEKKYE